MPEIFKRLTTPLTDKPSIYGRKLANKIDNPQGERGYGRGLLAGSIEGASDLVSDMTSPLSILGSLVGAAPFMRGARGIQSLGRINEARGITPSILPPELVNLGSEVAHNAPRLLGRGNIKNAEDAIYDIMMERMKFR